MHDTITDNPLKSMTLHIGPGPKFDGTTQRICNRPPSNMGEPIPFVRSNLFQANATTGGYWVRVDSVHCRRKLLEAILRYKKEIICLVITTISIYILFKKSPRFRKFIRQLNKKLKQINEYWVVKRILKLI